MFSNTIINFTITTIISILIILFIHYFWNYLIDNYSTKKTKYLVNSQIEKYKKIVNDIQENKNNNEGSQNDSFISDEEVQNMNNNLTDFINSQI
jgi:competence protein ComGC